ncbi:hypothetical protein BY996DRAFT_6425166 [Phakopsora pachyrhizi]|nr:hypothetical protein BY996DRAFT_6425166 [Phakopsora pachyrhizi]
MKTAIPEFDLAGPSGTTTSPTGLTNQEEEHPRQQSSSSSASRTRRFSSTSSRRNSDSTERRQVLLQSPAGPSSAVGDDDDEEDEEDLDPETKAKHDAFVRARKGHYGNEAEAMKRARELAEKEEAESEATVESDLPSEPASEESVKINGKC